MYTVYTCNSCSGVIIKLRLNHSSENLINHTNGFTILVILTTSISIDYLRVKIRNWPLFFIRWSAAFPSVLYSSLWSRTNHKSVVEKVGSQKVTPIGDGLSRGHKWVYF